VEPEPPREHVEVEPPSIDGNLLALARARLEKVTPALSSTSIRRMLERSEDVEPLRARIREQILKKGQ
jgi:4Fe-4S ferredoxin